MNREKLQQERFEKWILSTRKQTQPYGLTEHSDEGYLDLYTQKQWEGWKAALAAAPPNLSSQGAEEPMLRIREAIIRCDEREKAAQIGLEACGCGSSNPMRCGVYAGIMSQAEPSSATIEQVSGALSGEQCEEMRRDIGIVAAFTEEEKKE